MNRPSAIALTHPWPPLPTNLGKKQVLRLPNPSQTQALDEEVEDAMSFVDLETRKYLLGQRPEDTQRVLVPEIELAIYWDRHAYEYRVVRKPEAHKVERSKGWDKSAKGQSQIIPTLREHDFKSSKSENEGLCAKGNGLKPGSGSRSLVKTNGELDTPKVTPEPQTHNFVRKDSEPKDNPNSNKSPPESLEQKFASMRVREQFVANSRANGHNRNNILSSKITFGGESPMKGSNEPEEKVVNGTYSTTDALNLSGQQNLCSCHCRGHLQNDQGQGHSQEAYKPKPSQTVEKRDRASQTPILRECRCYCSSCTVRRTRSKSAAPKLVRSVSTEVGTTTGLNQFLAGRDLRPSTRTRAQTCKFRPPRRSNSEYTVSFRNPSKISEAENRILRNKILRNCFKESIFKG